MYNRCPQSFTECYHPFVENPIELSYFLRILLALEKHLLTRRKQLQFAAERKAHFI